MALENIHDIVRKAETNYLQGFTTLGKYVPWSMHDTIERIDAYLNSKHISGATDSLGRDKPFFDISTAIVNIWFRATDIDRKDIKFVPKKQSSIILAFVANVILQNWMNENRFGQFLNAWGRSLSRYGSSVIKFVEKKGQLTVTVVPWNRYIADPVQFDALPRIEKLYYTPAQLRKLKNYDQDEITRLIEARTARRTLDKQEKDVMNEFVELYEVHGELDSRLLDDEPDLNLDDKDIKYTQQMHVISYVHEGGDGYKDFSLFKGREAKDPYMITHLIEEDGRTLAIGAVEHAFEAQWQRNHSVKNMKDTLDLASKLIFQTSDGNFAGRNVLSAIETGDVLVYAHDKQPLTRIANDNPSIVALQNYGAMWQTMVQDLTSTPDAMRGNTMPSGTPYALGQLMAQQSNSLFELMTENKGLHIEDMMIEFIIDNIKKTLKHKDQIVAILDSAGIQEIDMMYIPHEAVKRYNAEATKTMLDGGMPSPFNPQAAQQDLMQQQSQQGNKRFFVPDEAGDKTWSDIFSDFEWDNVEVEITNENSDKQAILQTLNTVLQTISSNPMILNNPDARTIFNAILSETGKISPLQLAGNATLPPPRPTIRVSEGVDYKDLPPDAQQQMLEHIGINTQPQTPNSPQPAGGGGVGPLMGK